MFECFKIKKNEKEDKKEIKHMSVYVTIAICNNL